MVSLGPAAYCNVIKCKELGRNAELGACSDQTKVLIAGPLTVDTEGNVTTSGSINCTHHTIGNGFDTGELQHNGSVFYLKYPMVIQVVQVQTTSGSPTLHFNLVTAHGLQTGNTVAISGVESDVNGVSAASMNALDASIVTVTSDSSLEVGGTDIASHSSMVSIAGYVRFTKHVYIDMFGMGTAWSKSTTLPNPTHLNVAAY